MKAFLHRVVMAEVSARGLHRLPAGVDREVVPSRSRSRLGLHDYNFTPVRVASKGPPDVIGVGVRKNSDSARFSAFALGKQRAWVTCRGRASDMSTARR
jgi:hypothetical protein